MQSTFNNYNMKTENQNLLEKLNDWIAKSVMIKLVSIGFLILILLIPTNMIQSLIGERAALQQSVMHEISSKWGGEQTIGGPLLSIPYKRYYQTKEETKIVVEMLHVLPDELNITGEVVPEERYRGIYKTIVHQSKLTFSGQFSKPNLEGLGIDETDIHWKDAYVSIYIPDMSGIQNEVKLKWNNEISEFKPGIMAHGVFASGISAKAPWANTDLSPLNTVAFNVDLTLNGSEFLNFIPIGKTTTVQLSSVWPTPQFDGRFLPDSRQITENGFKAKWQVLDLNRNLPDVWTGSNQTMLESTFGVKLLVGVDHYQKSTRSAKYAVLTIFITFIVFFFVEILNKKRIHPLQYIMVGLALVIFYSLQLSMAEHIGFDLAYLISSIAIVILIGLYALSLFKDNRLTLLLSACVASVYGFLYVILQLNDFSLLIGSFGLLAILATVMYLSRNVNWYGSQNPQLQ